MVLKDLACFRIYAEAVHSDASYALDVDQGGAEEEEEEKSKLEMESGSQHLLSWHSRNNLTTYTHTHTNSHVRLYRSHYL